MPARCSSGPSSAGGISRGSARRSHLHEEPPHRDPRHEARGFLFRSPGSPAEQEVAMVVVMRTDAAEADVDRVVERVREAGGDAFVSPGKFRTIIGLVGDTDGFMGLPLAKLAGVEQVVKVGKPYKLVARELHPKPSTVHIGDAGIGRSTFSVIAGPCAVETREQALEAARAARRAGATVLRGGAYKPRTSPYAFQGLARQGLEILAECREETGLPVVTEVVDAGDVEHVVEVADALQIGTRNMQNFALLKEVGRVHKPVLLKRGLSAPV